MFVFRNNTIERFFPKDYTFSGYDDISFVPTDVDGYVWFYQLPVKYGQEILCSEIRGYAQKLAFESRVSHWSMMMVAMAEAEDMDHVVVLVRNVRKERAWSRC